MNKNFKCVIFDLDGTLIDSGPDLIDSLNYVLKSENYDSISSSVIGNLVGGGAEAMIRKGFKYLQKDLPKEKISYLIKNFLEFYSKNCTRKTKLYPGVYDLLVFLKNKKTKICLCTNKKQYLAEKILENLNIIDLFDYKIGSQDGFLLKPNTQMPLKCLENVTCDANQAIFVGDSNNDMIPANTLGMKSVFVSYGYGKESDIDKSDYIIDNIMDLKDIIFN